MQHDLRERMKKEASLQPACDVRLAPRIAELPMWDSPLVRFYPIEGRVGATAVRPSELLRFNFNDPDNRYLTLDRNPWIMVRATGALAICLVIALAGAFCERCGPPSTPTRGTAIVAVFLLAPVVVRLGVVLATFALIGEYFYRRTYCANRNMPAYAIGPSGIASLDPWSPCAFGWDEISEVRRDKAWGFTGTPHTLMLVFTARPRPPLTGIPTWLWDLVPAAFTRRQIVISPEGVGVSEDDILRHVRQFAGPLEVRENFVTH